MDISVNYIIISVSCIFGLFLFYFLISFLIKFYKNKKNNVLTCYVSINNDEYRPPLNIRIDSQQQQSQQYYQTTITPNVTSASLSQQSNLYPNIFIEPNKINNPSHLSESSKNQGNGVLDVQDIRIAQSHVIPIEGKQWVLNNKTYTLTIVPDRDSLLLAKFPNQNGTYLLKVYSENLDVIGSVKMNLPNELPPTEDNGPKYSTVHHSVKVPGQWIKKNIKIQFQDLSDSSVSTIFKPNVGIPREALLLILPLYLFGANDTNSQPFSKIKDIDSSIVDELYQKWSLGKLEAKNHPMGKIEWDYLIMPPRNNYTAMKITNSDQKTDGYAIMNAFLNILKSIRTANGEDSSPILIYTPILHLNKNGKFADVYGGLGAIGGEVCVGDHYYSGIFIHEIGHSWGMWHSEEAYKAKRYPYIRGSLKGSEWGFDTTHNEFLSIYLPKSAQYYPNCSSKFLLSDDGKYCIKQSVMQGGAGDQASNYRFSMFADFEMTVIQDNFETSVYYKNGVYQKWNTTSKEYYQFKPETQGDGIYGIVNQGFPIERNVDIYTVIFTISTVDPAELTQIYPIIKSKGNLLKQYDPTNEADRIEITPFTQGKVHSFCYEEGCDYTLRATYSDGSKRHILLPKGLRNWGKPNKEDYKQGDIYDPKSSKSFRLFTYNIKADKELSLVELLYNPMGWRGVPSDVKVLASRKL